MFSAQQSQVSADGPSYVEDVFSTYLYTGNGGTQTITNGIDLAGKGGLVWTKARSAANRHALIDTAQGGGWEIDSASTAARRSLNPANTFNASGYSINDSATSINSSAVTYASWTFRKAAKFFDVRTITGTGGVASYTHDLTIPPGFMIFKKINAADNWIVWHRSLPTSYLVLNSTAAAGAANFFSANATTFTDNLGVFEAGVQYICYLFAHDTSTDGVIQCGSFVTDGSGRANVTLGWEPQWVLKKIVSTTGFWTIGDNLRGLPVTSGSQAALYPNLSDAEVVGDDMAYPTATGFTGVGAAGHTYIYIAIRRGPMRTPTSGTSVFSIQTYADASLGTANPTLLGASTGFPVDLVIGAQRNQVYSKLYFADRLRGAANGVNNSLASAATTAEGTYDGLRGFDTQQGAYTNYNNAWYYYTDLGRTFVAYYLRRAPSFFDEVCYTGTGIARTVNHNLGVVPELMIVKNRSNATGADWSVYAASEGATKFLWLNSANASGAVSTYWNNTSPTSTAFSIGTNFRVNASGNTFVAYLFATCPGVSKVGSYSGTGAAQTINCGFTGGARFVLIKRTDSTGDWYLWDSARGITSGADPYLLMNSTDAEVTGTNYVDAASSGFTITSSAPAAINASGGNFIYLAVA